MSKNKKKKTLDKNAAKKAAVLRNDKKSRSSLFVTIICAVFLVGTLFFVIMGKAKDKYAVTEKFSTASSVSQFIYPVSFFDDGKARHFEYKHGNSTIKYFILKSSDGIIRAAFDACDVCWPEGKGYHQSGDYMVCRNCGRRFASVLVNVVQGGCNPAPLKRKVDNGNVVIQVKDIIDGKQYFDFSGRA